MSMPHKCRCGTCGCEMIWPGSEAIEAAQLAAQVNRAAGVRTLATAIMKIAPDAAAEIARRWEEVEQLERTALDEFLTFLRSRPTVRDEHA
jgi:hypothetical protein